jgi:hypothetical protein
MLLKSGASAPGQKWSNLGINGASPFFRFRVCSEGLYFGKKLPAAPLTSNRELRIRHDILAGQLPRHLNIRLKKKPRPARYLCLYVQFGISLVEPLHPSRRIYNLLFSGHEWMTFGTDFHLDVLFR